MKQQNHRTAMDPRHNLDPSSSAHYNPAAAPGHFPNIHDGSEDEFANFNPPPPDIVPDPHLARQAATHNMAMAADQHQQGHDNAPCGQPWPYGVPSVSMAPYSHGAASSNFPGPRQQEQPPHDQGPCAANNPGLLYQAALVPRAVHRAVHSPQRYHRPVPGPQLGYDQGQIPQPQFQQAMAQMPAVVGPPGYPDHRAAVAGVCLLYTSPSPRDVPRSRMPSSA